MTREERGKYMASREWYAKRNAVIERGGGNCERCRRLPGVHVHHLTYERMGCERLDDLQLLCNPCHEFLHAKRDVDPKLEVEVERAREERPLEDRDHFHGILAAMFLDPTSEVRKLMNERMELTMNDWADSSPRLAAIDRRIAEIGRERIVELRSMLRAVIDDRIERGSRSPSTD